ncbi:DNA repair protein RadA [Eubacteriales bacterium OttesenSCG-928-N14]|nr:DNA repair protein RadA [Eubacteriales bacterium OttesenSCG-928-N14]
MAKEKTIYICENCGYESPKWLGKCPGCNEWNTLLEQLAPQKKASAAARQFAAKPQLLADVQVVAAPRIQTGIAELDAVLGGGLVEGGVTLIGGEPGVGKSTLMLQACQHMATSGLDVLYVTGEESAAQVKLRAQRLGDIAPTLSILAETDMHAILSVMEQMQVPVVVIDSIQTMVLDEFTSTAGSLVQVRECANAALRYAKTAGACIFLVGHVTKEGSIAGPRILEHMVDTVLYFEGDKQGILRVLRAVKNRFGSTNEIGLFEMTSEGMVQVENPSEMLLSTHTSGQSGSAITCAMEGNRPVLCEIQALCVPTTYGNPRRMATGIDYNRMLLLLAVLEKRANLPMGTLDVYVNAPGGLRLNEPAADLCIATAIASAATGRVVHSGFALVGEIGLTGELRPVLNIGRRINEVARMGLGAVVVPQHGSEKLKIDGQIKTIPAKSLVDALNFSLQPLQKA